MKSLVILCCSLLVGLSAATAHTHSYSYSETREINLPYAGSLDAETLVGAITVNVWENDYVLLRAHISTSSFHNEYDARLIAGRVEIEASSTRVRVSGPSEQSWGVGFEIFVPRAASLRLRTKVGAISVTDVAGAVSAETSVGAMEFTRLGGALDAKTDVGGIHIKTPPAAASFDLRTSMGGIKTDVPGAHVEATSFFGRTLVFEAGSDGPRVHAETSVGGIDLML